MYVGRTGEKKKAGFKNRMNRHWAGAPNQAPLAKRLAEEKVDPMPKDELEKAEEFKAAKGRVRKMLVSWVTETDPDCRCLLEFYAAKELQTPYNDFSET